MYTLPLSERCPGVFSDENIFWAVKVLSTNCKNSSQVALVAQISFSFSASRMGGLFAFKMEWSWCASPAVSKCIVASAIVIRESGLLPAIASKQVLAKVCSCISCEVWLFAIMVMAYWVGEGDTIHRHTGLAHVSFCGMETGAVADM